MTSPYYERLSGADTMFLVMEESTVHMHVASVQILEGEQLRGAQGGVNFQKFRRCIESKLPAVPRYRQKVRSAPLIGSPVWVDDPSFNLSYHVRHSALPKPGTEKQLKNLAARIMSQQLDRTKPLWESWLVEGLEGDRVAVITKVHHCMIDGVSGVDLSHILMSPQADYEEPAELPPFEPRPVPADLRLVTDELSRVAGLPRRMFDGLARFGREKEDVIEEVTVRGKAFLDLIVTGMSGDGDSEKEKEMGPHRRFDWLEMNLDDVKRTRRALGCTLNDVVLATVAGAARDLVIRQGEDPGTTRFRVSAPVSVRKEEQKGKLGNQVSSWIIDLPIAQADPLERVELISEKTRELKRSRNALGVQMLMRAADWTPTMLLSLGARAARGQVDMIVTNVPGPQFPLYMAGAKTLALYPQVPLIPGTPLGAALFSYDGKLFWGFNAEYDQYRLLWKFCDAIRDSFDELARLAAPETANEAATEA